MTKALIRKELARAEARLVELDPADALYGRVLGVYAMLSDLLGGDDGADGSDAESALDGQLTLFDARTEKQPEGESTDAPQEEGPSGESGEPAGEPVTKEYVRDLLKEVSRRGVQIQPILCRFVPDGKPVKFSEVPAARYGDMVEVLKNA